jgi:NAD(P)H-dependent flavin oxidoreductase YrpB (nitropropane dioxygenase family)
VISGTGIDVVMIRTLQKGDPNGDVRRALATFPDQHMAQRILDKYYIPGGKDATQPFRPLPMWTVDPPQTLLEVTVAANYCEVWLAKHNQDGTPTGGLVGINRLTKVQLPTIASLYGAMLADVDYVIMGAGIPLQVPGVLDDLANNHDTTFPVEVQGLDEQFAIKFSPKEFWKAAGKPYLAEIKLKRPDFVPIVSSVVLAQSMLKRATGKGPTGNPRVCRRASHGRRSQCSSPRISLRSCWKESRGGFE